MSSSRNLFLSLENGIISPWDFKQFYVLYVWIYVFYVFYVIMFHLDGDYLFCWKKD